MIAVFPRIGWTLVTRNSQQSGRSMSTAVQDFESCSGDAGSLSFHLLDEFMGRFGYTGDHGGVVSGAMSISVMYLQDPHDKPPIASPAPSGVSQDIPTIQLPQSAGIPRKLRRPGIFKNERYDLRPLVNGLEELWGLPSASSPHSAPSTASGLLVECMRRVDSGVSGGRDVGPEE